MVLESAALLLGDLKVCRYRERFSDITPWPHGESMTTTKQLEEVCHSLTLSKHTSIITSQIKFADDKCTYMFNIDVCLYCNGMIFKEGMKDALGLIVGDYPEPSNLSNFDMLSRRSMGST